MLWTSYTDLTGRARTGVIKDDQVHAFPADLDFTALLKSATPLAEWADRVLANPDEIIPINRSTPAALVPRPPSIRDFMAFEEHVVTSNAALGLPLDPAWYEIPVFYFSNPAAMRSPGADISIAPGSTKFDYELEFAVVIGKAGADIAVQDAESHIAGYMALCDWSARDLQEREMRLTLGPAKGKDTATTLGPILATPDELEPLRRDKGFDITITASVNGRTYSTGNLSTLYWSFAQMIAFASRGTELRPGDVIGSGTVGTGCILELSRVHGGEAYPYLTADDEVVIDAGPLGTFGTRVVAGGEPQPL
jgi:2-keto-4-pentenoate hydratase/2-oxohepta-3-ene-1,7-dioic acid hydratase in catechol pathway